MPKEQQHEAYCVKCRAKRKMQEPEVNQMSNGRHMLQGRCVKCETKMTRILSKDDPMIEEHSQKSKSSVRVKPKVASSSGGKKKSPTSSRR